MTLLFFLFLRYPTKVLIPFFQKLLWEIGQRLSFKKSFLPDVRELQEQVHLTNLFHQGVQMKIVKSQKEGSYKGYSQGDAMDFDVKLIKDRVIKKAFATSIWNKIIGLREVSPSFTRRDVGKAQNIIKGVKEKVTIFFEIFVFKKKTFGSPKKEKFFGELKSSWPTPKNGQSQTTKRLD